MKKRIYAVVNLPCKEIDGRRKRVYNIYRKIYIIPKKICSRATLCIYHCGDVSGEVPPVLIPNTEVKLTSAENTLLETAREDRLLLHPIKRILS